MIRPGGVKDIGTFGWQAVHEARHHQSESKKRDNLGCQNGR